MSESLVLDASSVVDILIGSTRSDTIIARISNTDLHAPSHFDAEVLSALGRRFRAGDFDEEQVTAMIKRFCSVPIKRHELAPLLRGAWHRRDNVRLVDAIYVELADRLDLTLLTTDSRLASVVPLAELVE